MLIRTKGSDFTNIQEFDSTELAIRIARGDIDGYNADVHGLIQATATSTTRLAWELAATYTPFTAAKALSISSSHSGDQARAVYITYLDSNWDLQSATIYTDATDGQTEKATGITAWRVLSAEYADATAPQGNIYIYDAADSAVAGVPSDLTKVARYINLTDRVDNSCFYTIPNGYEGFLFKSYAELISTGSASTANDSISFREKFSKMPASTRLQPVTEGYLACSLGGTTASEHAHTIPKHLPAKTDIYLNYTAATAANLKATCGLELWVIKTTALDG